MARKTVQRPCRVHEVVASTVSKEFLIRLGLVVILTAMMVVVRTFHQGWMDPLFLPPSNIQKVVRWEVARSGMKRAREHSDELTKHLTQMAPIQQCHHIHTVVPHLKLSTYTIVHLAPLYMTRIVCLILIIRIFIIPAWAFSRLAGTPTKTRATYQPHQNYFHTMASLLDSWLEHDSLEFHHFAPEEAALIRQALLDWYDQHRRKLPWRGDPPPWEGSTADFGKKDKKKQKKMHDFFATKKQPANQNLPTFPVTPYGVWVSEIMLQQTRVEAVVPYWVRWMQSFPTVSDLAKATEEQVNAHFAGLGFYRRARLLHQACQHLHEKHDGIMPQTSQELMELPGVGRYTACAIASIAHVEPVAVVDGNVCRVLSRLRGIANQIKAPAMKDKFGWDLAQQLIEAGDGSRPGDVNQAIMELGATYCAPSGTGTDSDDPLVEFYWSTKLGQDYHTQKRQGRTNFFVQETDCPICVSDGIQQALESMDELAEKMTTAPSREPWDIIASQSGHGALPLAPPKPTRREEVLAIAVLSSEDGSYLMVKRPPNGLLAGQWEFPATSVWTSETRVKEIEIPGIVPATRKKELNALLSDLCTDTDGVKVMPRAAWQQQRKVHDVTVEHIFSHVRHTMWIEHKEITSLEYEMSIRKWQDKNGREVRWMTADEMSTVGITSGVKKILKAIESKKKSPRPKKKQKK